MSVSKHKSYKNDLSTMTRFLITNVWTLLELTDQRFNDILHGCRYLGALDGELSNTGVL